LLSFHINLYISPYVVRIPFLRVYADLALP
jgi:hypothetical protein